MSVFAVVLATCAVLGNSHIANAGTITIYANDGSGWQSLATASGTNPEAATANNVPVPTTSGTFTFKNSSAAMVDGPNADLFSTNLQITRTATAGSNHILIAVVAQGFSAPTLAPIQVWSSPTGASNSISSVTFQAYVDTNNGGNPASLAGGQGLQTATISNGNPTFPQLITYIGSNLNNPFSVSQLFDLTVTGQGTVVSLGGDTQLQSVPEPASMSLLGIGLVGMVAYGWRKRRQQITQTVA
jgi:hypothetical protein